MTQEETIRQIAMIAWKGAANALPLYPDNEYTLSDYWDAAKSQFDEFRRQQPIPQDINKLREEIKRWTKYSHAAKEVANLLLPQLQAQQERNERLRKEFKIESDKSWNLQNENRAQQSQIEELKTENRRTS